MAQKIHPSHSLAILRLQLYSTHTIDMHVNLHRCESMCVRKGGERERGNSKRQREGLEVAWPAPGGEQVWNALSSSSSSS